MNSPKAARHKSPKKNRSPPRKPTAKSPRRSPARQNSSIVVLNQTVKSQPQDTQEFHNKCLEDGFKMLPVHLWKGDLTDAEWIATQESVLEIDNLANPASTPRKVQKPFFRYISTDSSGNFKPHGGGYYLYTGWTESTEQGASKTTNLSIKGKMPVYMRMKNAVAAASNRPNISVQWNKVVAIYYKPPEQMQSSVMLKGNNGTIVKLIQSG